MAMDETMQKAEAKRKPALKRKGALEVMIAVGVPKKGITPAKAPVKPGREDEASPADAAEDEAEYGAEGGMCECPECGHKFRAGEHMAEDMAEDDGESEDESESED